MQPLHHSPWRGWWAFGISTEWRLRWQGWRDARRHLPLIPSDGSPLGWTPQLLALEAAARHDYNVEVEHHAAAVLALLSRQNDTQARADVAHQQAADADATAKARWKNHDQDLDRRLAGEDHLSPTVVRQRRRKELERAREDCFAPEQAARRAIAAVQAELTSLAQERVSLDERLPFRCQAVEEHYRHQVAVYWRSLVRHHPSGARLIALGLAPQPGSYSRWAGELVSSR